MNSEPNERDLTQQFVAACVVGAIYLCCFALAGIGLVAFLKHP